MMKVPPVILVLDEDGSMWAVSPHGEGWVGDEHAPDPREVAEFLSILYNTGFEADFDSTHNDWVTAYGVLLR